MPNQVWFWLIFIASIVQPVAIFIGRNWLKASIEKSVQHRFGTRIENVRSELRNSEERIKSELRYKENEIQSLRERVLENRANRQMIVERRRLEAAENVWRATHKLSYYKTSAMILSMFKLDELAKQAPVNEKLRQLLDLLVIDLLPAETLSSAKVEQLFVSESAWAYFSTYKTIIVIANSQISSLKAGLIDTHKMVDANKVCDIVKNTLPNRSGYIDEYGMSAVYLLLDEVEQQILAELRYSIGGKSVDDVDLLRASEILKIIRDIESQDGIQIRESIGMPLS